MSRALAFGSAPPFFGAALLLLAACHLVEPMPADQPCKEVGWAIAARTHACTGDVEAANTAFEHFEDETSCIEWEADDPRLDELGAEDLFSCAYTLRNLPCETVEGLGDDIEAWLAADPSCDWVVEWEGGAP
jgi:hypothetical protein